MRIEAFDYHLPENLIAQSPAQPRDSARLLVLHRASGKMEHRQVRDLPDYLRPGDALALNTTRVILARLFGQRVATGGKWEALFLRDLPEGWEMLTKTRGRPHEGERVRLQTGHELELIRKTDAGTWLARPVDPANTPSAGELLQAVGHIPLPQYIRRGTDQAEDRDCYQTVYARQPGAVAAPTAGLHFTEELLQKLQSQGVHRAEVVLHVGPGTFQPIKVDDLAHHRIHPEWGEVTDATAARLQAARAAGGRIAAVGTTTTRLLESACAATGVLAPFKGETTLFITPTYTFRAVDVLLTNFHLPRTTLLVLVCAFANRDQILAAYREAVRQKYRFYSYGDAMLIL